MKSSGLKPRVRVHAQAKGADRSAPSRRKLLEYDHCLGAGGGLLLGAAEGAGLDGEILLFAPVVVAVLPPVGAGAGVIALPLVVAGGFDATG